MVAMTKVVKGRTTACLISGGSDDQGIGSEVTSLRRPILQHTSVPPSGKQRQVSTMEACLQRSSGGPVMLCFLEYL